MEEIQLRNNKVNDTCHRFDGIKRICLLKELNMLCRTFHVCLFAHRDMLISPLYWSWAWLQTFVLPGRLGSFRLTVRLDDIQGLFNLNDSMILYRILLLSIATETVNIFLPVWIEYHHRIVWLGTDLWRSSSPTPPCNEQGYLQLGRWYITTGWLVFFVKKNSNGFSMVSFFMGP